MSDPNLHYLKVSESALPTGGSTSAKQAEISAKIDQVISALSSLKSVLSPGAATAANQASEIALLNSLDVKTPELTGGSIPVIGPVTNTELRASAVPVSGPVTDTQLRAVAVPVSGPLTDTQLRLSAVPVSVATMPIPTGAATSANQTGGGQKTQVVDASNNTIGSLLCTDGSYSLEVSAIQNVYADSRNTDLNYECNAANSYTYTGLYTSTLGVAGIQVTLKATNNCTVYVDQSPDHTNWDIVDTFNYYTAVGNFGTTVQAVNSYFRVRVVSISTTTTIRLQSCLCPIVEVVPRSLDPDGLFNTTVSKITGRMGRVRVSPMGSLRVSESTRLAGSTFIGTTVDSNYWAVASPVGTGTAAQAGGILTLSTGATANSAQTVNSLRTARYVASCPNYYRGVVTAPAVTTSSAGFTNVRRFGAFDTLDGYFFMLSQTNPATSPTFSIVTRKTVGGVTTDTPVNSGSFNGDLGSTYTFGTNCMTVEIWWTNKSAWFFIDDVLLHKVTSTVTTAVATPSLKVGMEIVNGGTNTANNTLEIRAATISRLGQLLTQPTYKYQAGTTAAGGVQCKIGPGNLHAILLSGVVTSCEVTLFDNTTAATTIVWYSGSMNEKTDPFEVHFDGLPFHTGLNLLIADANCNATVIYE